MAILQRVIVALVCTSRYSSDNNLNSLSFNPKLSKADLRSLSDLDKDFTQRQAAPLIMPSLYIYIYIFIYLFSNNLIIEGMHLVSTSNILHISCVQQIVAKVSRELCNSKFSLVSSFSSKSSG